MSHPCHKEQIPSIKRIEGQVKGILRMIESEEYCIDILNQLKAAKKCYLDSRGKNFKESFTGMC